MGCAGGVGASTVALALATAAGVPARVVECCSPLASGFPAAANAELETEGTSRRGSRGDVLLERPITGDATVPVPTESSVEWTFVDTNWTTVSGAGAGWLGSVLRALADVVLVTNATVPGLRGLESCAELLGRDALGVVLGPTAKRWPRPVKVAAAGMPARVHITDCPLDPCSWVSTPPPWWPAGGFDPARRRWESPTGMLNVGLWSPEQGCGHERDDRCERCLGNLNQGP